MLEKHIGAEQITWDLSFIYNGVNDPQINRDILQLEKLAATFNASYKGQLAAKLGEAILDYSAIKTLGDKIMVYLFLKQSLDVADALVKSKISEAEQKVNAIYGQHLTFFILELVALEDAAIEALCARDGTVKKHRPWILRQRVFKPHLLTEAVESALTKRASFGSGAWGEFFDECEADLQFNHGGEKKNLTQMLNIMSHSTDAKERAAAMQAVNWGFSGYFAKYSAQALYMVAGEASVERKERNYRHPMEGQNKSNNIPDQVVDALHEAVLETAAPLAQRYYRIKAGLLGLKTLAWSDRNAPLPFSDTSITPFNEAMETVLAAYESFSPTLAGIVRDFAANNNIDAPAVQGKRGGAFNYSCILPDGKTHSFTLLNYLGSGRDVMTLAHELGHAVHGILAGQAQGPLMFHAPIAYCETASVFGEMTTFNFLKKQLQQKNDTDGLIALLAGKIEDMLNTVVRQIGFSNFERRVHGMDAVYQQWLEPKKLSAQELNEFWMLTTKELYGKEGDVFHYENMEYLWSYVGHFHRPFYVYGYAFGELLTQSLYAKQAGLGKDFEPLYLELLRSGSTKNAVELLAPFGINPTDKDFWKEGIKVSLEAMVNELESLLQTKK